MIAIVGRFPPPLDGQTLATRRLADLLDGKRRTIRLNTEPPGSRVSSRAGLRPGRILHFLRLRSLLRKRLAAAERPIVLWASISPSVLGHVRDRISILPACPDPARVAAVVHRGEFSDLFTARLTRRSALRMVRRIGMFVFLSEELSSLCAKWIPEEKRTVIPNTIDDDLIFSESEVTESRRVKSNRREFRVLFLTNMIPEKGYMDVADALLSIPDDRVRADFAGAWQRESDRADFMAWIMKNGLSDRIRVHGPVVDRSSVKSLYWNADVLVLPTRMNEAQPLVIIEAMNAGLPVIASDRGAIPEIVKDGVNGFILPTDGGPSTARRIGEFLARMRAGSTWSELSDGARSTFSDRYSPAAVRERWLDLLERMGDGTA